MTKDFALVIWGDGNHPVSITADHSTTETHRRLGWHYLTMLDDDQNRAEESWADECDTHPQQTYTDGYHADTSINPPFTIGDSRCGWSSRASWSDHGDYTLLLKGGCGLDITAAGYTVKMPVVLPTDWWSQVFISHGSVEIDHEAVVEGANTKKYFKLV